MGLLCDVAKTGKMPGENRHRGDNDWIAELKLKWAEYVGGVVDIGDGALGSHNTAFKRVG
jgi:hypothetical protein